MNNCYPLFAEFLGTFCLTLVIQTNTKYFEGTQSNDPFIIMAVFTIAISITREISGGHINPGVTLSFYLKDKEKKDVNLNIPYIIVQCFGAFCAAILGLIINDNIFKLTLSENYSSFSGFILEMLGSALFYSVILIQSDNDRNTIYTNKTLSTLIITAGLGCGCAIAGQISGAGLNPAIAFAFNFGRVLQTGKVGEAKYLWLYILSPCLGAVIAVWFYYNVYDKYYIVKENNEGMMSNTQLNKDIKKEEFILEMKNKNKETYDSQEVKNEMNKGGNKPKEESKLIELKEFK